MKHAGIGSSRRPAAEQARAAARRQPGGRTTRPRPNGAGSRAWLGGWCLDVGDAGELLAVHETTGTVRVLATPDTEGGDQ